MSKNKKTNLYINFMRKGDKFKSIFDIRDSFDRLIFKKGDVYEILYINNETFNVKICLSHIKYEENEYYDPEWIVKNFKKI